MNATARILALSALLPAFAGMQSCSPTDPPRGTYEVDAVRFVLSNPNSAAAGPAPGIWIDTNVKLSGLSGGTVKSRKPYGIGIDYTDNTFAFAALEFTSVSLTYDDGAVEPQTRTLKMPLRIDAHKYEAVNSVGGGRTVKTTTRILSAKLPGMITRDEPFTLRIKGQFTRNDGTTIPFLIDQHYDIEKESTTKSAADIFEDC